MPKPKRIPNKKKWLNDLVRQAQDWEDDNEAYAILGQLAAYPYLIPRCGDCDALLWYDSEQERGLCSRCNSARYLAKHKAEWLAKVATMTYAEYRNTNQWGDYMIATLTRSKFYCDVCHSDTTTVGTLAVYHHTKANLGCETPADVIILCAKCRAEYTGEIVDE
jgi:hypothetical protein